MVLSKRVEAFKYFQNCFGRDSNKIADIAPNKRHTYGLRIAVKDGLTRGHEHSTIVASGLSQN